MRALITGASSGIGLEIARELAKLGHDLTIVARRENLLNNIKKDFEQTYKINVKVVAMNVAVQDNCKKLYEENKDVQILINNAGFGKIGFLTDSNIDDELEMIDLNIKSLYTLTRLYTEYFCTKNEGYVLNVASMGSYVNGALLANYFASKHYVLSLTRALRYEIKKRHLKVNISVVCPGTTSTEFFKMSGSQRGAHGMDAKKVAKIAVKGLFEGKEVIIPGSKNKLLKTTSQILPSKISSGIVYKYNLKK